MTTHSMLRATWLIAIGCSWVPTPQAQSAEFTPNHLFVTSQNTHRIYEFDSAGALVREIDTGALGCVGPTGLAFSPSGTLFVASSSNNLIIEIRSDGTLANSFGLGAGVGSPAQIAFGPDGNLYIGASLFNGFEVRRSDGTAITTLQSALGLHTDGLAVGPDGTVWTTSANSEIAAHWDLTPFDPRIYNLSFLSDDSAGGMTFDSRGRLHIVFKEGVHLYDGKMNKVGEYGESIFTSLSTEQGVAIGPNAHSFVCGKFSARVYEFDPDTDQMVREIGAGIIATAASHCAFSPFRFKVAIQGPAVFEGGAKKLNEKGASLTVFPGAGRAYLQFDDATLNLQDFASLFSSTTLVCTGFEEEKSGKLHRFGGSQVPFGSATLGSAALALELEGKTDPATGFFSVTSASGSLQRSGQAGLLVATVKTTKLLK